MKTYKIKFCYGGRSIGDAVHYATITNAKDKEEALEKFKKEYNYEVILGIERVKE